jgi:hypothetical protein
MVELTPSQKGAAAEAAITSAVIQLGLTVLRPLCEGRRYDLIVDLEPASGTDGKQSGRGHHMGPRPRTAGDQETPGRLGSDDSGGELNFPDQTAGL